jgi:hypothetical protein
MDRKVEYKLSSRTQARALFTKFFSYPASTAPAASQLTLSDSDISVLADNFASQLPELEFSTAQIQGYLLGHRLSPKTAAANVSDWVLGERADRQREEVQRKPGQHLNDARSSSYERRNSFNTTGSRPQQLHTPDPTPKHSPEQSSLGLTLDQPR